jgi:catechol 2,3-dioxygenase-like lactoylglutathione lyase family enzyme
VAALKEAGVEGRWTEGDLGHGPAFAFAAPDGHRVELYYETEWYEPTETDHPALKNQRSRFPARGANLRRLDHCNLFAADVRASRAFFERLGMRLTEQIVFDDGSEKGAWLSVNNKTYELAIEFDHQWGVALATDGWNHDHIHTVVRTPNGNDYGRDLLRQHHAQHDHGHPHSHHLVGPGR